MKRQLVWLLVAVLVLTGCTAKQPDTTLPHTAESTQGSTQPPAQNLHLEESGVEKQSGGSVQVYGTEGIVNDIGFMGEDLVIFCLAEDGEQTTVIRMGTDGTVKAEGILPGWIAPSSGNAAMTEDQLVYYCYEEQCCRILDKKFQQIDQAKMPEGVEEVLFSSKLREAYYFLDSEIRSMDLQTGIPRLVCRINAQSVWMNALLLNDTVLCATVMDDSQNVYDAFFSAETGINLGQDPEMISAAGWENSYILRRTDGILIEVLLGTGDKPLKSFNADMAYADVHALPGSDVLAETGYEDGGAVISVFDMDKGNRMARLQLPGTVCIYSLAEDPAGSRVWFIADDPELEKDVVCCWDYTATDGTDGLVRIGNRATAQKPDQEGLANCRARADALEDKYGVEILLNTEAVEPEDYRFTCEYQVETITQSLAALDSALARFPEGFLENVGDGQKISISIIRKAVALHDNAPDTTAGVQYLFDGEAYIALVAGDTLEQNLLHEMSHVLDTYVRSNSIYYDFWEDNNPQGFVYDECYTKYESHYGSPWLDGDTRAFVDAYSMTYAREDRARFLEYAMMEGNEEVFASETMQKKLMQLCMGIREAFGWEALEQTLPWEQYLLSPVVFPEPPW